MADSGTPVVFIHGLWLHATSWRAWEDLFRGHGYDPIAPGWPGDADTVEATRADPQALAGHGVDEVTDHFATIIKALPAPPILIGHSFGGLIVEKLMGQSLGVAGVAIDAAPIKGVLPIPISALRASFPVLKNPANRSKAVALTSAQFRYAFANAVTQEESDALYAAWAIPAPGKPLFQAATANLNPRAETKVDVANATRGPLLLLMGSMDHTVPEAITKATMKQYRDSEAVTELTQMPGRGHSLTIDSGWTEVADVVLSWLKDKGL